MSPSPVASCNAVRVAGHSQSCEGGLVVAALSADERTERFAALFNALVPSVRGFVRTMVVPSEVESIVLSTFETAWTKLDVIPPLSQRAWLFGVARNHVRNSVRAERRREALVGAMSALRQEREVSLFAEVVDPAAIDALTNALARLSDLDREVVQLTVWHEFDAIEVAEVLGTTAGNVRVRLHRARRRLAELMADGEAEQ